LGGTRFFSEIGWGKRKAKRGGKKGKRGQRLALVRKVTGIEKLVRVIRTSMKKRGGGRKREREERRGGCLYAFLR